MKREKFDELHNAFLRSYHQGDQKEVDSVRWKPSQPQYKALKATVENIVEAAV